jgi:ribose-phosphate pyrophosphokinase
MRRLVLAMPGNEAFAKRLADCIRSDVAHLEWRRFPDRESYVRIAADVRDAQVVLVCTLADPDPQSLSLLYAARTARDLGAARVTLVAPCLAYMRQDAVFRKGEALSATYFAELISLYFDEMVTVDPHLHRHKALSEIYTIPTRVVHAAPLVADWISAHVERPVIIGPDEESLQWASDIARRCAAPSTVLRKVRTGDREVDITLNDMSPWKDHQPVLVDDIVSSGRTMIETAKRLRAANSSPPVCIAVHAVFADRSFQDLSDVASAVVSTDAISHESNRIGIASAVGEGLETLWAGIAP